MGSLPERRGPSRSAIGSPPERALAARERPDRSARQRGAAVFFAPAFGWPWPYPYLSGTAALSAPLASPPAPPAGRLHLDVQSGIDPQIYVDGYYVGLFSDSNGDLMLDAGPHTIELKEEGFETLRVDVQVPLDGAITFRGELKRVVSSGADLLGPRAAVADLAGPRPEVPPTTIYLIPGCYVGNVPPAEAKLPAGCDADRAVAFPSR